VVAPAGVTPAAKPHWWKRLGIEKAVWQTWTWEQKITAINAYRVAHGKPKL
jgi:hypothetical protein